MSIGPIDQNPIDEDEVTIVDPGDVTVEPSYGHDTQPWDTRGGHADPDAENITHVPGVSRGREVDGMDFFDLDHRSPDGGRGIDPDAAFLSGTGTRPDRYVHDEALQVRQLLANKFLVTRILFPVGVANLVPQMVLPERPERISLLIVLIGSAPATPCYIGPSSAAVSAAGYPLFSQDGAGATPAPAVFHHTAELWMAGDGVNSFTVHVLETIRTDVDSQ